eukprot:13868452-Alexandrium_andersonii.AAC.1
MVAKASHAESGSGSRCDQERPSRPAARRRKRFAAKRRSMPVKGSRAGTGASAGGAMWAAYRAR